MDPLTIIAGAKAAGDVTGLGLNAYSAFKNYELQKENLEYQKSLQKTMFRREDNAVTRRAADMERAGFSKTLAAGNAASAGPVINTAPPRVEMPQLPDTAMQMYQLLRGKYDISQAQEQLKLTQLQQEQTKVGMLKTYADINNVDASTRKTNVDTMINSRDLALSVKTGLKSNPSMMGSIAGDAVNYLDNMVQTFKGLPIFQKDEKDKKKKAGTK